jgi:hypothetical protein
LGSFGTAEVPGGGDHFFEQTVLHAIGGTEAVDELVMQFLETGGGLIGEDNAFGEQAVAEGVA